MKNKWRNYALKDGKIQSSYIREYSNRKKVRKTREASNCDSNEQSGKEQEEIEELIRPPIPPAISDLLEEEVDWLGKIVELKEDPIPRHPDAEKEVQLIYKPPTHHKVGINPIILNDAWVVNLRGSNETSREENPSETYQEGRQGVPSSDQRRCEAQERNTKIQSGEKKVKKEKETMKHKKHEASESKAYEKKEDRKEAKKESKPSSKRK